MGIGSCLQSEVISIHALRGESDEAWIDWKSGTGYFNPRSPWGERPSGLWAWYRSQRFQSTLSVGRATRRAHLCAGYRSISIHALRGESDCAGNSFSDPHRISIHALRGESDLPPPSLWPIPINFNPRSPWGERPFDDDTGLFHSLISIHALRGESDCKILLKKWVLLVFQSTLSVGRATKKL